MAVSNIRSWLRRSPQPTKVLADGREVAIGTHRSRFADAEQTILELSPSKLEALDDEGRLIRICVLGDEPTAADEPDDDAAFSVKGGSRDTELAALILKATDMGARRHAEAYSLAFDRMTQIVTMALDRLGALEVAWQQALNDRAVYAGGGDSREGAVEQGLMTMLASQAMRGQSPRPKPNGKADGHGNG